MKSKKNNLKTFFIISFSFLTLYLIFSFIYITYIDREKPNSSNYELQQIQSTTDVQTVENVTNNSTTIFIIPYNIIYCKKNT